MKARNFVRQVAIPFVVVFPLLLLFSAIGEKHHAFAQASNDDHSVRAFSAVASVLTSPRCLNCHVPDDGPLQGDDNHPHTMNVKRGPDGRGTPAMRCTNCHQDTNSQFLHAPPGRADWRLPPPSMPLVWKGLSIAGICRSVKNPATNGGMSTAQLIEHVRDDPFVNWAWNPGPGRTQPPISHDEFVARFTEWVQTGAACPKE
ncbi:MAG TPA: hypothetical protein VHM93_22795 [Candidatus Acidoferrum sp.]|jgi:hypothetical protein|nr:hypothetical protein [Candidatus Acidoferrum sp.]